MKTLRKWLELSPDLLTVFNSLCTRDGDFLGENVEPAPVNTFRALELLSPEDVRVVILGQDPYHTPGKASGIAFGYRRGYTGPVDSSMENIIHEVGLDPSTVSRDWLTLEHWVRQGVLLLNTRLTVEAGKPMSHAGRGWETAIEVILQQLDRMHPDLVFLNLGAEARKAVDSAVGKYYGLSVSHPSRYSAMHGRRPFIGSNCFNRINEMLVDTGKQPINWIGESA